MPGMMDPAIFRPADGYEVPDAAAILSLRGTRHKNIWLSPTQLSQMTLADVKGILAEYGEAFDACIEEAMDGHDPDLIGSTTELVNEATAFVSIIEILQPEACTWWMNPNSSAMPARKSWSVLLDDLDLSSEQAHRLVRLHLKVKNRLLALSGDRAAALLAAQQESMMDMEVGSSIPGLLDAANQHRLLVQKIQASLNALYGSLGKLRDEVIRKVLHPLQAAMVYRAFSPLPPDTLTLLEEIRKRHCARISLDLALWTHERENERTYAFDATEGTYSVECGNGRKVNRRVLRHLMKNSEFEVQVPTNVMIKLLNYLKDPGASTGATLYSLHDYAYCPFTSPDPDVLSECRAVPCHQEEFNLLKYVR